MQMRIEPIQKTATTVFGAIVTGVDLNHLSDEEWEVIEAASTHCNSSGNVSGHFRIGFYHRASYFSSSIRIGHCHSAGNICSS